MDIFENRTPELQEGKKKWIPQLLNFTKKEQGMLEYYSVNIVLLFGTPGALHVPYMYFNT